jgi:CheY-like chemotaxis protein
VAKVLIVDDDDDIATMLKEFAARAGVESVVASSGAWALSSYWGAVAEGKMFEAIFLDVALPIMDGLTVAKRIREAEREMGLKVRTFIYGLTAHPEDQLSKTALARAQLDRYTTKPGDTAELAAILQWIVGGRRGEIK